jgi:hypothetical protein
MENRAPDDWTPDNSLSGKTADVPCPPCKICGQPMYYMFTLLGVATMHQGTDEFLCAE